MSRLGCVRRRDTLVGPSCAGRDRSGLDGSQQRVRRVRPPHDLIEHRRRLRLGDRRRSSSRSRRSPGSRQRRQQGRLQWSGRPPDPRGWPAMLSSALPRARRDGQEAGRDVDAAIVGVSAESSSPQQSGRVLRSDDGKRAGLVPSRDDRASRRHSWPGRRAAVVERLPASAHQAAIDPVSIRAIARVTAALSGSGLRSTFAAATSSDSPPPGSAAGATAATKSVSAPGRALAPGIGDVAWPRARWPPR